MVKNIILKVLMLAVIMIFSMQAGAQTITGLSTGMEYFLIGAVAFTVFALVLAAYLWIKQKISERSRFENWSCSPNRFG
jgi:hypothetical protein